MQIFSFSPFGYEGTLVTVEVDLRRGIPAIDMVGLADGAVKEARERMHSAVLNSGFDFPPERIIISLSPADLKKEGAGFDLALALAVLAQSCGLKDTLQGPCLVMGELELSGRVRSVRGVNAAAATAAEQGIKACIVPAANATEAEVIDGMHVFPATDLRSAFEGLKNQHNWTCSAYPKENSKTSEVQVIFPQLSSALEFSEIRGQQNLVRGLQIAAAGNHSLLAYGSPGCGKTLALQKFPALLPYLTAEESQSVTRIYSLAGMLPPGHCSQNTDGKTGKVVTAPFRVPHQSASLEGIVGGGPQCRPGEISLAHNGVLFLDEAAEFKSSVLQTLRVPLETGAVTLSRAGRSTTFPAKFQLLAAANPCPCGNFGVPGKICLCSARAVEMYWKRFSAPLLDRIDIRVPVFLPEKDAGFCDTTENLRKEIARATYIQRKRQGKKNAYLLPEEINTYCELSKDGQELLSEAAGQNAFSPRAVASCLKLGRTIADMAGEEKISVKAIEEAIHYRKNEGGVSMCF